MSATIVILAIFGALVLLKNISTFIYRVFLPGRFSKSYIPSNFGSWSIVTGATDGIGKAICFSLAKRGQNLILISRTQSKLDEVKRSILEKYKGIEIVTLQVDYGKFACKEENEDEMSNYEKVRKLLDEYKKDGKEIGILVNNVGMGYEHPMFFHELKDVEVQQLVDINVTSTANMTHLFLSSILNSTQKSNGKAKPKLVVSIGSYGGLFPSPFLAEYSAAKSFTLMLSSSLASEYALAREMHLKEGEVELKFQCHVPMYVVSKMSKFRKSSFSVPTAESYAESVMENLGKDIVVSGNVAHRLQTEALRFVPDYFYQKLVGKMHLSIRKTALKKKERVAKSD